MCRKVGGGVTRADRISTESGDVRVWAGWWERVPSPSVWSCGRTACGFGPSGWSCGRTACGFGAITVAH